MASRHAGCPARASSLAIDYDGSPAAPDAWRQRAQEGQMDRRTVLTSGAALAASFGGLRAAAAQPGGSPVMRMRVPLAAGGAVDPYARVIAEHMARTLGRVIIVDNKPGASGNVGTQYAAHEPADGNLILVTTQAITEINPSSFGDAK